MSQNVSVVQELFLGFFGRMTEVVPFRPKSTSKGTDDVHRATIKHMIEVLKEYAESDEIDAVFLAIVPIDEPEETRLSYSIAARTNSFALHAALAIGIDEVKDGIREREELNLSEE